MFKKFKLISENDELIICFLIGIYFFLLSFSISKQVDFDVYSKFNLFYGADFPRVISNSIDINSDHSRMTSFHPLFSLILMPISNLLLLAGASLKDSVQIIVSFSGSFCGVVMYLIYRNLDLKKIDSTLLLLAFSSSSAYIFWWSVPETFPIGGMSIITAFYLLSIRTQSFMKWFIVSFFTISISTTNFMASIITIYFGKIKNSIKILVFSTLSVLLLSFFQTYIIPSARWMLRGFSPWVSKNDIFVPGLHKIIDFFVFSFVAARPELAVANNGLDTISQQLDILDSNSIIIIDQLGIINSFDFSQYYSIYFLIPFFIWIIILFLASINFFINRKSDTKLFRDLSKSALLFIFGQFALHQIFGDMPFIFSAHFCIGVFLFLSNIFTNQRNILFVRSLLITFIIFAIPWNIEMFLNALKLSAG